MSETEAYRLFVAFHDREPGKNEIVRVATDGPVDALVVGELEGVIYRVKGEKKAFIHRFKSSNRPILLVSSDGRQIYTLMGAYEFTEKGFEG